MQFHSFAAFVAMGGHGFYVWLAYSAFLVVMLAVVVTGYRNRRQILRREARRMRREQRHGNDDTFSHAG